MSRTALVRRLLASIAVAAALGLAACGDSGDDDSGDTGSAGSSSAGELDDDHHVHEQRRQPLLTAAKGAYSY